MSAIYATGRRKTSIAKVFLSTGSGAITVNSLPLEQRYPYQFDRDFILAPLRAAGKEAQYNLSIVAHGGGATGQKGAIRLAISRAVVSSDPLTRPALKELKFLTRDPRSVQPKQAGKIKARKKTQFSKR